MSKICEICKITPTNTRANNVYIGNTRFSKIWICEVCYMEASE